MKKQSSRFVGRLRCRRYQCAHQFDHVVPTVIHHPEEKMTALGRWTHHVLQDPKKYSTWAIVIGLGVVVAFVGWNVATGGRSRTSEVWSKLDAAKKAEDRVEIAKENPKSPASTWALLQAANLYFDDGTKDLPNNRDVAVPNFGKAAQALRPGGAPRRYDSFQARAAVLGKARSLEASYDLSKAIEQYELVVKNWPASAEAEQAKELAKALQKPEAAAFYKELYAYAPTKVTLPALGSERFDFPMSGPGARFGPAGKPSSLSNLPLELAPPTLGPIRGNACSGWGEGQAVRPHARTPGRRLLVEARRRPGKVATLRITSAPVGSPCVASNPPVYSPR